MEFDSGLKVCESWLSPEFSGLFTTRRFTEGEVVCVYQGQVLKTAEAIRLEDKRYLMRLGEQSYVDSRPTTDCLARYINDCRNPAGYNVTFEKRPLEERALVLATRDIEIGEELFVDYGKWFWAGNSSETPLRLGYSDLRRLRDSLVTAST